MSNDWRHIILTPAEEQLVAAIRERVHRGICPQDAAARITRLVQADPRSPDGRWLYAQGIFEPQEVG